MNVLAAARQVAECVTGDRESDDTMLAELRSVLAATPADAVVISARLLQGAVNEINHACDGLQGTRQHLHGWALREVAYQLQKRIDDQKAAVLRDEGAGT